MPIVNLLDSKSGLVKSGLSVLLGQSLTMVY